jgi:pimeloyl-ACP methyl ester carboxylesterase
VDPIAAIAGTRVQDEYVELRGLRFHYRDWPAARADAPTLVLLHGYTGHARSWDHFAAHMSDRYRVLALDQRGHGESAWAPAGQYGTDEMVQDLRAFERALGLRGHHLLGLSMGGIVGFHHAGGTRAATGEAIGLPEELARLVLVDIGPELIASGAARIQDSKRATDVFATKDEAVAQQRAANTRAPDAHLRHRMENNLMLLADGRWTWRYDRVLRDPRNLGARDPAAGWAAIAAIRVPTLLIRGGESDLLAPEVAARMVRDLPDGHFEEVAGSGHSVPLDAPDAFLAAARRFLTG